MVSEFADQMHQEQQRAVRYSRQTRPEATVVALEDILVLDLLLDLFPVHPEGRVGEHVIKLVGVELVLRQGIAQLDTTDILPLDQHIRLTDSIGFWVQLLAKCAHHCIGVQLVHVLHTTGQEAARTCCWVINGADNPFFCQRIIVFHEH